MYWVYTLVCEDGSLYTGFTDDIKRRIRAHYYRQKTAAKYTKSHKVTGLSGLWKSESETAARKLEYRIKKLPRDKKLLLLEEQKRVLDFFPELSEYLIEPDFDIKFEDCI